MTVTVLSIVLNVIVLLFLGVTIYYAIRLTESLNVFRRSKQEFEAVMRTLDRNINDAQRSIEKLKDTSKEAGQNLQKVINDSRKMAIELDTINQQSGNLAGQLEAMAGGDMLDDPAVFDELFREAEGEAGFSIFDRDHEEPAAKEEKIPGFQSKAEQDLYEALQRTRKSSGRGAA